MTTPQVASATPRPTQWKNTPIAKFVYRDITAHKAIEDVAVPRSRWTNSSRDLLQGGASYEDALRAASRFQKRDPLNHAMAVLKDASGTFWLAPLGGKQVDRHSVDGYMQENLKTYGPYRYKFKSVQRMSADVQAIVGVKEIIDLRNAPIVK